METPEEIAQWVIDNRYPKSENNKVSDFEMYHEISDAINKLLNDQYNQFMYPSIDGSV